MRTLTVTQVARRFSEVIDRVERDGEDVVLVRHRRAIARLVPESPAQNALEVLGDLYRTLDDATADALTAAVSRTRKGAGGIIGRMRNPWAA